MAHTGTGWRFSVAVPLYIQSKDQDGAEVVLYRVNVLLQAPDASQHEARQLGRPPFFVLRRYSQFRHLYEQLKAQLPEVMKDRGMIPPPKHALHLGNVKEMLDRRRDELEKWLWRLLAKPEVTRSHVLRSFLEIDKAIAKAQATRQQQRQASTQGSPSSPTHSITSNATGWYGAASRVGPSGPPSEAGDWQGAGHSLEPEQWGHEDSSLRPTMSRASFTTQSERLEDGGLGPGHVLSLHALPSSSLLDVGGHSSGGRMVQRNEPSSAGAAIGAGIQRLGVRLESRADLRRLIDMLERRLEKAATDLASAAGEAEMLAEANRLMGARIVELELQLQGTGQLAQQASLEAALSEARTQLADARAQLATTTSGVSGSQLAAPISGTSSAAQDVLSGSPAAAAAAAAAAVPNDSQVVADLRARVAELERGAEMADAEAGELREALGASEHIRTELSRQLATVEEGVASRVAMLKAQVTTLQEQLAESHKENAELLTKLQDWGISSRRASIAGHTAPGSRDSQSGTSTPLTTVQEAQGQQDAVQGAAVAQQLSARLSATKPDYEAALATLAAVQAEVAQLRADKDQLAGALTASKEAAAKAAEKARSDHVVLAKEVKRLRGELAAAQADLAKAQQQQQHHAPEIGPGLPADIPASLAGQARELGSQLSEVTLRWEAALAEVAAQGELTQQAQAQASAAEERQQEAHMAAEAARQQAANVNQELTRTQEELRVLQAQLAELTNAKAHGEQQAEAEAAAASAALQASQTAQQELQERVQVLTVQLESSQQALQVAEQRVSALQVGVDQARDAASAAVLQHHQELEVLRSQLAQAETAAQAAAATWSARLAEAQAHAAEAGALRSAAEESVAQLQGTVAELQQRLADTSSQAAEAQQQAATLEREVESLRAELQASHGRQAQSTEQSHRGGVGSDQGVQTSAPAVAEAGVQADSWDASAQQPPAGKGSFVGQDTATQTRRPPQLVHTPAGVQTEAHTTPVAEAQTQELASVTATPAVPAVATNALAEQAVQLADQLGQVTLRLEAALQEATQHATSAQAAQAEVEALRSQLQQAQQAGAAGAAHSQEQLGEALAQVELGAQQVHELMAQLGVTQAQLTGAQGELAQLQTHLQAAEGLADSVKLQHDSLQQQLVSSLTASASATEREEVLQSCLAELQKQVAEASDREAHALAELESLHRQLSSTNARLDEMEQQQQQQQEEEEAPRSSQASRVSELEQQLEQARTAGQQAEAQLAELQQQVSNMQADTQSADANLVVMQQQLEAARTRAGSAEAQVQELRQQLGALVAEHSKQQQEAQEQLQALQARVSQLSSHQAQAAGSGRVSSPGRDSGPGTPDAADQEEEVRGGGRPGFSGRGHWQGTLDASESEAVIAAQSGRIQALQEELDRREAQLQEQVALVHQLTAEVQRLRAAAHAAATSSAALPAVPAPGGVGDLLSFDEDDLLAPGPPPTHPAPAATPAPAPTPSPQQVLLELAHVKQQLAQVQGELAAMSQERDRLAAQLAQTSAALAAAKAAASTTQHPTSDGTASAFEAQLDGVLSSQRGLGLDQLLAAINALTQDCAAMLEQLRQADAGPALAKLERAAAHSSGVTGPQVDAELDSFMAALGTSNEQVDRLGKQVTALTGSVHLLLSMDSSPELQAAEEGMRGLLRGLLLEGVRMAVALNELRCERALAVASEATARLSAARPGSTRPPPQQQQQRAASQVASRPEAGSRPATASNGFHAPPGPAPNSPSAPGAPSLVNTLGQGLFAALGGAGSGSGQQGAPQQPRRQQVPLLPQGSSIFGGGQRVPVVAQRGVFASLIGAGGTGHQDGQPQTPNGAHQANGYQPPNIID